MIPDCPNILSIHVTEKKKRTLPELDLDIDTFILVMLTFDEHNVQSDFNICIEKYENERKKKQQKKMTTCSVDIPKHTREKSMKVNVSMVQTEEKTQSKENIRSECIYEM